MAEFRSLKKYRKLFGEFYSRVIVKHESSLCCTCETDLLLNLGCEDEFLSENWPNCSK